jgi:hypothetical protein
MGAHVAVRVVVSSAALVLLGLHLWFPAWRVDAISVALLLVAVLPWLHHVFKDIKLSRDGIEISYADTQQAMDRAVKGVALAGQGKPAAPGTPSWMRLATDDPNLALVALRIEIEGRLRALGRKHGLAFRGLMALLDDLTASEVLDGETARGLRALILAGNRAAHGAQVDADLGHLLSRRVPELLEGLDRLVGPAGAAPVAAEAS